MTEDVQDKWLVSTYRAKPGSHMSVTDLCRPSYQLWVKLNLPTTYEPPKTTSFKSYLGSALHHFIEQIDEDDTIKEFSHLRQEGEYVIGGTTDELRFMGDKWRLGDIKLKGAFPSKKFLGIGTKAKPNPKPEQDKERIQMSLYRWLFEGMFDIQDEAVIYLFTAGHTSREAFPEYQTVPLQLMPLEEAKQYVVDKIKSVETEPEVDCETNWLCSYCEYKDFCPKMNTKEFDDER